MLKFIGYKAPDSFTQDSTAGPLSNGTSSAPLSRQQTALVEQAIMDAFLTGDEGSWGRLLEVTGAQEGAGNPACINVAHQATGEKGVACHQLNVNSEDKLFRVMKGYQQEG